MAPLFPIGMMVGAIMVPACVYSQNQLQYIRQDFQSGYFQGQRQNKLVYPSDFYDYARIRDDEFSETLKETWHDYSIFPGVAEEPGLCFINQPVYEYSSLEMSTPVNLPYSGVVELSDIKMGQSKSFPGIRKPENERSSVIKGSFLFYGHQITIDYDKLLIRSTTCSVSEDSVAGFWKTFSQSNSNLLVNQLMDYRDRMGLGDWGYFQLVKACSNHICRDIQWNSDQLTWGLMIRSGFDVRLAFNQRSTTVLFPSESVIFEKQFIMIGPMRFYLDRPMSNPLLVTCPNPFPAAERAIDLKFNKSLNFHGKLTSRVFNITRKNKKYRFALRVNPESIRFYTDYPKTDPAVYYGAPVSSQLKEDLLRQLYPILSQINKAEALTILQQFVQNEVTYVAAPKKGEAIPCRFAEQVIASNSGGDLGKAVFFAWLTRTLLGLPVVGLHFPGYYSTAVSFDEQMDGDSYNWNRAKYLIADPTFKNVPVGAVMPEIAGLTPQLIILPNCGSRPDNEGQIWNLAYKMGASRSGVDQDVLFDKQGRGLITGYFSTRRSNNPFVACFSERKELQWIRRFEGEGLAAPLFITKVNEDEIYIAGSFSGKFNMDGKTIESYPDRSSLLLAHFNPLGELVWMKRVPIDSTMENQRLNYTVSFDRTGNNISIQWSNEDLRNLMIGFHGVSTMGLTFTGSGNFGSSTGYPARQGDQGTVSAALVREFKRLKGNVHRDVSGVIAVMKYLEKSGNEVTGNQIQTFISTINPTFATTHPGLFTTLGRITLMKNEYGIITLKTSDHKSLLFNSIKIENWARFIVTDFENGDISIAAVSGFRNIGNPLTLILNKLLIDSSSGGIILDYDRDHTQKTIFLKPTL